MERSNGRRPSATPSTASEDFYHTSASAQDAPQSQANGHVSAPQGNVQAATGDTVEDEHDSGSEMDMDMSDASSIMSAEPETNGANHAGMKRKLSDAVLEEESTATSTEEPQKKCRISTPVSSSAVADVSAGKELPVGLWQQVFMQLPPAGLTNCLRVCRKFNNWLTNFKAPLATKNAPKVRILDSEVIWMNSRKNTYSTMPKPLQGFTELEMLQLLGCQNCQSCGKAPVKPPATNYFNLGPGENGVRVIWPFHLRICGSCFRRDAFTDIEVLQSAAASLRFGLPHAFRTQDDHFVFDLVKQTPPGIPGHLRVMKTYHKRDLEAITSEFDEVRGYGEGAADEWCKGLAQTGKDAMTDASRWERWEHNLPPGTVLANLLREYDPLSFPFHMAKLQQPTAVVNGAHATAQVPNGFHALPQPVHHFPTAQGSLPPPPGLPLPIHQHIQRTIRGPQEVKAARDARKADIERRCMELNPPLLPAVLERIKAFKDTMQITTPLTDSQWETMLKPKILEEREAAELEAHEAQQRLALLQAAVPSTMSDEVFIRPAKEVYDREYEQAQEPLRTRLGEFADDYVNGHWHGGRSLDRDTGPLFAVEVLLHVRQRYLADRDAGTLPSSAHRSPRSTSSKRSTPPLDPFLSLDNVKWVFDNKIRKYTDQHRRELFICAGCIEDRKPKWFAFEGLIQHYGAKHTAAFSRGNVVVHWQTAEWPDEPPFYSDPSHWIKAERKSTNAKHHNRARGTPHASNDGPFEAPAVGPLLSENPLFSNGSPTTGSSQNGHHGYGHSTNGQPGYGQNSRPHQLQPQGPFVDRSKEAQVHNVSINAREVWDKLDGVDNMLECIRMQTVIHHVIARFSDHFKERPNLDTLTDALATNALMRPIKNANTLACKLCIAGTPEAAQHQTYAQRIRGMKVYNASSLIIHFKISHQSHGTLQWDRDMMEMPETQQITGLLRAPGMDDEKLALVADAFPSAFPSPLPKIGLVAEALPDPGPDSGLASRLLKKFSKKGPQASKKKKGHAHANGRDTSEPLPEPSENEYDPRKPMFPQTKDAKDDPSRFDTDLRPKTAFNLAPETLVALSSLTASLKGYAAPAAQINRASRSPSVGRAEVKMEHVQAPYGNGLPAGTPDIAAILASLTASTNQPAASTPQSGPMYGSAHTPIQPYGPYAQPAQQMTPVYPPAEKRRPSSRYVSGGSYRGSVEPATAPPPAAAYDGQDLQAALTRNGASYASNSQPQYSMEPAYAAPPQQQQRSPPRYRVVYEDQPTYAPQPPQQYYRQHHEVHGQPAPIQYLPADGEIAPVQYHRARPAPPPQIYYDEYGRAMELVPIDTAVAPVQYMPHPFEQQQQQQYARQGYATAPQPPQQQLPSRMYEPAPQYMGGGRYVYDRDQERGSVPRG